ncbi:GNAT family N-acetyltransferase [Altererythrobacter sp. MF3-039]|uniref:GNAT family N-acetyltransferase n=1 Tax=Altererythrobacter sp. MF3-039 TaxID=3252901 RepID=UPI00390C736C
MGEGGWRILWIDLSTASLLENVAPGVFDESIKPDRLERYLAQPTNWLGVALEGELVVGQVMCVVHDHPDKQTEIFLDEIGTGDEWRRKGIANALIKAVFERADEAGIDEIWLGTEPDNLPARGLYEKTGAKGEPALIYYLEW